MKKRAFAAILALVMAFSLLPTWALALDDSFADVTDANVARNVEVLQLMGVISGDGNGLFRPYSSLTRAEFCKMAVELQGNGALASSYRSRTVFPDVRASHWAAGYINFATKPADEKSQGLMHGFPDGMFLPDQEISFAEAVTVLMRVLGYTDADSGGAWPQGYLDLASGKKLTAGLSLDSGAAITRAQAAKLFVNVLSVEKAGKSGSGDTLYTLGKKETTLLSVDLSKGTMRTADGENTLMVHPKAISALRGLRGYLVTNASGKALTFLPTNDLSNNVGETVANGASSDAAVVVAADGSTAGFDALAGGKTNYKIYRNGTRVNSSALKKYDVATYSAGSNAILVCDTRVQVYYESCTPSPNAPVEISALKGTKFNVLSTARQGLSEFKPGAQMVLLLTSDGQLAGAVKPGTPGAMANAIGYVNKEGKVQMFCGADFVTINTTDTAKAGQVVSIGQAKSENVILTQQANQVNGALDLSTNSVGTTKLADNVLVLQDGVLTSLASLGVSRLEANRIAYARRNSSGEIDLVVLGVAKGNTIYGRLIVNTTPVWDSVDEKYVDTYTLSIDDGSGKASGPYGFVNNSSATRPISNSFDASTGDFVTLQLSEGEEKTVVKVEKMKKSTAVSRASWVGKDVATANGVTYSIPSDIPCWNADSKTWFKDLDTALDYGGTMYFYIADDAVRVIEFHG